MFKKSLDYGVEEKCINDDSSNLPSPGPSYGMPVSKPSKSAFCKSGIPSRFGTQASKAAASTEACPTPTAGKCVPSVTLTRKKLLKEFTPSRRPR